jgi:hypothetical protein
LSFQVVEVFLGIVAQVQVTLVPRCGRSMVSTSKSPAPPLAQRTPWSAGTPARRDSTVMRSATMKPE